MAKIGDVIEIELPNNKLAYAQYVFSDKQQGPLIQIYDLVVENRISDIGEIQNSKPLFPPIITGLNAAVRNKLWFIVGNIPVNNFCYPSFISAHYNEKTGEAICWFLWNGKEYKKIGPNLPTKFKNLEYLVVWSPYDVIDRIVSDAYPFPYGDLIRDNKFEPVIDAK